MSAFSINSRVLSAVIIMSFFVSCTTFMRDDQAEDIMKLDKASGIMQKAAARDEYRLEKGQKVKLHILLSDDNIKVYAYPAEIEFLKSNRLLLLYLFENDFKDGRFDKKIFMEKLGDSVTLVK